MGCPPDFRVAAKMGRNGSFAPSLGEFSPLRTEISFHGLQNQNYLLICITINQFIKLALFLLHEQKIRPDRMPGRVHSNVEGSSMPMPDSKVIPFNRKKWLLIIEDDNLVREGIALALTNNGFKVHTAETGEEALHAIDQKAYDGIICDYHLPGMNGLDFFRRAGSRLLNSTNILMTAFGFDQIFDHAPVLGIDAFCEKPFSIPSLISALNSGKMRSPQGSSGWGDFHQLPPGAVHAALKGHQTLYDRGADEMAP